MALVSNIKLAWLAGILDGEGTITAFATKPRMVKGTKGRTYQSRGQLTTTISLTNTDANMIVAVRQIVEEMGVKCHVHLHDPRGKRRECWYLMIAGFRRVGEVLSQVKPYLVTKRAQAELLLTMIRHRQKTQDVRTSFGPRTSFRDDEWLMKQLASIQGMNSRGPL